jgi:CO/xanthine dehydrogenase FAD-binding subunit
MGLVLLRCKTPEAAVAALQDDRARAIGGGTVVLRMTNTGDASIDTLVRLDDSASRSIDVNGMRVRLGCAVTMSQIIRHPALSWLAPAARAVGGPAIRNMATVGGNLFGSAPYGDFAAALLALDARLTVQNPHGRMDMPIAEFFARREPDLCKALVQDIRFNAVTASQFLYRKVSRTHPKGIAVLTIAATLVERGGLIAEARIAYGAMARTPMRAGAVEAALLGQPRTLEGVGLALAVALRDTQPSDDPISSGWYKSAVLPVHLRRLLVGESERA